MSLDVHSRFIVLAANNFRRSPRRSSRSPGNRNESNQPDRTSRIGVNPTNADLDGVIGWGSSKGKGTIVGLDTATGVPNDYWSSR